MALRRAYESVIRQVLPSVVQITTGTALGSGIVFDDKGDVVTNAHVVGDVTSFSRVTYATSATPPPIYVGTYGPDDLAVIHVQDAHGGTGHVRRFERGRRRHHRARDGNPLGLSGSVTNGIVSAVGRTVSEGNQAPGATLPDAIQTSASINPGNSGGALVDLQGHVHRHPLAALDPELGGSAAPGIGFAIPSDREGHRRAAGGQRARHRLAPRGDRRRRHRRHRRPGQACRCRRRLGGARRPGGDRPASRRAT